MGRITGIEMPTSQINFQKQAKILFEPQLAKLSLSREQIEQQTLNELQESLIRIDEAINNPELFGIMKLQITADGVLSISSTEAHIEIGILPTLLERKKLILDRIKLLRGEKKVESLRDLIEKVSDENIKVNLLDQINQLEEESKKWQEQSTEVEQAQIAEEIKVKTELARLQAEIFERRSKVWQSFLEKESVATIVGSLLLVLIACSLILAMFIGIKTTDIVNNGFLVILGYFFGQTVSRKNTDTRK